MVNGGLFIGAWIDGKRCGWGRLVQGSFDRPRASPAAADPATSDDVRAANGHEYLGEWRHGVKEGKGQYFYHDRGMVYEGEWVNDVAQCGAFSAIDDADDAAVRLPVVWWWNDRTIGRSGTSTTR